MLGQICADICAFKIGKKKPLSESWKSIKTYLKTEVLYKSKCCPRISCVFLSYCNWVVYIWFYNDWVLSPWGPISNKLIGICLKNFSTGNQIDEIGILTKTQETGIHWMICYLKSPSPLHFKNLLSSGQLKTIESNVAPEKNHYHPIVLKKSSSKFIYSRL